MSIPCKNNYNNQLIHPLKLSYMTVYWLPVGCLVCLCFRPVLPICWQSDRNKHNQSYLKAMATIQMYRNCIVNNVSFGFWLWWRTLYTVQEMMCCVWKMSEEKIHKLSRKRYFLPQTQNKEFICPRLQVGQYMPCVFPMMAQLLPIATVTVNRQWLTASDG